MTILERTNIHQSGASKTVWGSPVSDGQCRGYAADGKLEIVISVAGYNRRSERMVLIDGDKFDALLNLMIEANPKAAEKAINKAWVKFRPTAK